MPIDTYIHCLAELVCKGVSIQLAQLNRYVRVSIHIACNKTKFRVIEESLLTALLIQYSIHVGLEPVRYIVKGQNIYLV